MTGGAGGMLGRHAEMAAVTAFLDAAQRAPRSLVLEGPAGIGKSTLWLEGCARAAPRTVLACRPAEQERDMAYSAIGDLLEPVDERLLDEIPGVQRAVLDVVLLRAAPASTTVGERTIGRAVLSVVQRLAEAGPLLIAVDDLQWVDVSSAHALAYTFRRLTDEPVGVLASRRPGRGAMEPPERLVAGDVVHVGPLDLDTLAEVVTRRADRKLLLPVLVQLHRAAEGNPFLAIELARALDRHGGLPEAGRPLPVPADLRSLVEDRLAELSRDARALLETAALTARPTPAGLLAVLGSQAVEALDEALAAGILEERSDRLSFSHPLLAAAVRAAVPPGRARDVHRALAEHADDVEQRARHLALATDAPDPEVVASLELAASDAQARGAPASAAELLDLALRLAPEGHPGDAARVLAAAQAHHAAGDARRARGLLEAAVGRHPAGAERSRLLTLLARILSWESNERAAPVYQQAITEAPGPREAALVEAELAWSLATSGRVDDGLRRAERGLALAEEASEPVALAEALTMAATLRFIHGDGRQPGLLDRAAAALGDEAGRAAPLLHARMIQAVWSDEFDEATRCIEALAAPARALGDEYELLALGWYEAVVEHRRGRWDRALSVLTRDQRRVELLETDGEDPPGTWLRALVLSHLGHVEEATALARRGAAAGGPHDPFTVGCEAVLGFLALSAGDATAAASSLGPLPARIRAAGYGEPGFFRYAPDVVEAALGVGDLDGAAATTDWLQEAGDRTGNRWAAAAAARCAGLLLAARRRPDAALERLDEAVRLHEPLDQPFELARTLLVTGGVQRRLKRKAAARSLLERAEELLRALPAPLWVARVEAELSRLGGRPSSPQALTPTEQRVAELVAGGASNREVAEALFVSAKTVEWTLSKVYRKLDVRSRSELASRWPLLRT